MRLADYQTLRWPAFSVLAVLLAVLISAGSVAAAETEEEEARERAERSAPPGGFREGKKTSQEVPVFLDGKQVGSITTEKLEQVRDRKIFSPRGPKRGWLLVDAIRGEGVSNAKSIKFFSDAGKEMGLNWADLNRKEDQVVLTYNFNGELILETDVAEKVPDHVKDGDEDRQRDAMHKGRQKSLIFMRGIQRIELSSN